MSVISPPQPILTLTAPPTHSLSVAPDVLYEVVDGEIVEKGPMSAEAILLAGELHFHIRLYLQDHRRGRPLVEQLYLLPLSGRQRQRRPDASYVSYDRWPADRPVPGTDPWPVVPDMATEVVRPTNTGEHLMEKIEEFFEAGVRLVWVIYPGRKFIQVYTSLTVARGLTKDDVLDGGDVLPGFRLPLSRLFAVTEVTPQPAT